MRVNDAIGKVVSNGTGLTAEQTKMLNGKGLSNEDKDKLRAQMMLQNQQELMTFITNIMKKRSEIAMSVINNLR